MAKKQVTIPIFVPHEGCPHQCAFCNQFQVSGEKITANQQTVIDEIEKYKKTIPKSVTHIEVAFFGGSFTGINTELQEELLNSVQSYFKSGFLKGIRLSTRPDYINSEKLDLLKKYNVSTIELGVQSFNDNVLKLAKRGHSARDVINAAKLIKNYNFNLIIQLMPGLPGDNFDISIENTHQAVKLKPNGIRIYPTIVLKNTYLEKMFNNNEFKPLTLEKAIDTTATIKNIFDKHNIPIIRMGLHPLTNEETKNIIAGPYHTAFGFLVKSRIKRNKIEKKIIDFLNGCNNYKSIHINIPYIKSEEYIGTKKQNIIDLQNTFKNIKITYSVSKKEYISISGEN